MSQKIALQLGAGGRVIGYSTLIIQSGHVLTDLEAIESDYTNYIYKDGQLVRAEIPAGYELRHDGTVVQNHIGAAFWVKDTAKPYFFGDTHKDKSWDGFGDVPNWLTAQEPVSQAFDWSEKSQSWIENKEKAKALSKEQTEKMIAEKVEAMRRGVQDWLDSEAQNAGFDNIDKAVLRAGYDGPLRKIGTAYAVWMDTVWLECKTLLTRWQQGEVNLETFDDVKAHLTAPPSLT